MGHQVHLDEPRTLLIPLREGADGYGSFEQTTRLGGTEGTTSTSLAVWPEKPVYGRWAHTAQLPLYLGL
jgi:hypothetical protein